MHYKTFKEACDKWNERKKRMQTDPNKIGFMLTNYEEDEQLLERFEKLPFKHKVAFVYKDYPQYKSSFCLKGFKSLYRYEKYLCHSINYGKKVY